MQGRVLNIQESKINRTLDTRSLFIYNDGKKKTKIYTTLLISVHFYVIDYIETKQNEI